MDSWSELRQQPLTVESILMQHIWYNQFIMISGQPIKKMFPFKLFMADLYESNALIPWAVFKVKFNLTDSEYFKWRQIIASIPQNWKAKVCENDEQPHPQKIQHVLQLSRPLPIEKLTSKQLYLLLVHNLKNPPTSQTNISQKLGEIEIDWGKVYSFGRKITIDSYGRMFHFKCSHNILFLNKALFRMNISNSSLCSYCHIFEETIDHLFAQCEIVKKLWIDLGNEFSGITFPTLTSKSAFFGFYELNDILMNHIHLIFRIAIYNKREAGYCSILFIKNKIRSIKNIEENLTYSNIDRAQANLLKWARCQHL